MMDGKRCNIKTQRCYKHDYRAVCIYLFTVTVEGRRPLLGRLEGDVQSAHVTLSPLGEAVRYELYALCDRYPQLGLLQYQIMPDHVHVVLHVREYLPKPVGQLLASWKIACGQAYARLTAPGASTGARDEGEGRTDEAIPGASTGAWEEGAASPSLGEAVLAPSYRRLFSAGYNDSILQGKAQLQHIIGYVRDNPRRLMIKRRCGDYFVIHRRLQVGPYTMDAIGNLSLLYRPLKAVHCRRHWTEEQQLAYRRQCLDAARTGTVLIGAFVSPTERSIALAASRERLPLVHIMENGFDALYKPTGQAFYTCAEGRLLQLAPWPYHTGRRVVSREQCNALNTMAESIARA